MTFAMREKNYLTRENNLDKQADREGRALDAKIRAHKERLQNKLGALERRIEKEEKRLAKDISALDVIKQMKIYCDNADTALRDLRKGKMSSDAYRELVLALSEGGRMSDRLTIKQFTECVTKINQAALRYAGWHSKSGSDEGKLKYKIAMGLADVSKKAFDTFNKATSFTVDKNKSLAKIISGRKANLASMKQQLGIEPEVNVQAKQEVKKQEVIKAIKNKYYMVLGNGRYVIREAIGE